MDNKKIVAVIGLGYVGLPLAVLCAHKGYKVLGIDVNESVVSCVNARKSPIEDSELDARLKALGPDTTGIGHGRIELSNLHATSDASRLQEADVVIVCVPTPVNGNKKPDLRPLKSACESISQFIVQGQLISIESTVNPGTLDDVAMPILEKSGLSVGVGFDLVH
jgi:nucleotide sugar dehydrogenase